MRQALSAAAFILLLATPALAERESLSFSLAEQRLNDPPAQAGGEANEQPDADLTFNTVSHRFGEAGTWWWGVGAMGTLSSDATDARMDVTVRTFLAEDFEFNLSLSGWAFFQDGEDAQGVNPGLAFRWHFINRDTWTIFADGGISLLGATDNVPDLGTGFDFMPRIGGGFTYAITDNARLMGGVRWHHISNASTSGTDDNPARDSIAIWLGVIFPF